MKLKNVFISLVTVLVVLYIGLIDVSGRVTKAPVNAPVNNIVKTTDTWEYKRIDGVCYLIIYNDGDAIETVIPVLTEFCD